MNNIIAMKNLVTILTFFVLAISANAQQGEILYTKFDPDWCLESIQYAPADTIKLDFDGDGIWDLAIRMFWQRYIDIRFIPANGWEYRSRITNDTLLPPSFQHLGLAEADTIVPYTPPFGWKKDPYYRATGMCGIRKVVNDSTIYYGWLDQIWIDSSIPGNQNGGIPYIKEYECVRSMAFCTVPNYPLRWGQIDYVGIEEDEAVAFATVHPNPTAGKATIVGESLRHAEGKYALKPCEYAKNCLSLPRINN